MTKNRRAKRDARELRDLTGQAYVSARRDTLRPGIPVTASRVFTDDACANCLRPLPEREAGLFCTDFCQETAKHVRYFRRVFRDGRIVDPEVQAAVRTRLGFLPVGGYVALRRALPPAVRAAVVERDGGLCQSCGNRGSEIDHISGSSSELANLRLLCRDCHLEKTQSTLVPASDEVKELVEALMADRVFVDAPVLLADDEDGVHGWNAAWRGLKAARRERLEDELDELGVDVTGLEYRSEWIDERDDFLTDIADDSYGGPGDYDGGFGSDSYFARSTQKAD